MRMFVVFIRVITMLMRLNIELMKLSNIFLSTLAVLLCCTACSKDDESFKGKDADASLSIAVKAAGSAVTMRMSWPERPK